MAHSEHMHRRAFLKGAVAAIAIANFAGTAAVATEVSFPTPDMMRMAADGMLTMYRRFGVEFVPQPNGSVGKSIYIGEDTTYDHDAVSRLDQRMKDWPELKQVVLDRVRERHGA